MDVAAFCIVDLLKQVLYKFSVHSCSSEVGEVLSEVCVDTWELLQRIPVNPLLERKIKSVLLPSSLLSEDEAKRALPNTVTVNWPALIQPLSAGQCLYGLQIVDGLLKKVRAHDTSSLFVTSPF